jgi:hypothetical protein
MIKLFKNIPIKKYNQIISRSLFDYKDPFYLEKQLSDDEKTIQHMAHNFSNKYLLPNVVQSFRNTSIILYI